MKFIKYLSVFVTGFVMGYLLSKNADNAVVENDYQDDDFMDWVEDNINVN